MSNNPGTSGSAYGYGYSTRQWSANSSMTADSVFWPRSIRECSKPPSSITNKDPLTQEEKEIIKVDLKPGDIETLYRIWDKFPMVYRIYDSQPGGGPSLLQQVCKERGWIESDPIDKSRKYHTAYNLWWTTSIQQSKFLAPYQISNHIPGCANVFCRKDSLVRYLRRLSTCNGPLYNFSPMSFNLPLDYVRLCNEHSQRHQRLTYLEEKGIDYSIKEIPKAPIWICKPVGKSQGKGIILFNKITELVYDNSSVVQEYLHRPYLIGGYKWDLRIYVVITCVKPLTIYAYREGLTRFATEKFDLNRLHNPYSHLTNSSLNKGGPNYNTCKDIVGPGCKWSLRHLRNYLAEIGTSDWFMWQKICSILVLTIIGDGNNISNLNAGSSFEFLGFDIMVDKRLRPTLLEVNVNPGLNNDCDVDRIVKKDLLHDLFDLILLPDGRQIDIHYGNIVQANTMRHYPQRPYSGPEDIRPGGIILHHHDKPRKGKEAKKKVPLTTSTCTEAIVPKLTMQQKARKAEVRKGSTGGMKYADRDWYGAAPDTCGNWVKIFPFNNTTKEIAKGFIPEKDIKILINQCGNVLKKASKVFRANKRMSDAFYDKALENDSTFFGPSWHPPGPEDMRRMGPRSIDRAMTFLNRGRFYQ